MLSSRLLGAAAVERLSEQEQKGSDHRLYAR
jgi:hypothetical protein